MSQERHKMSRFDWRVGVMWPWDVGYLGVYLGPLMFDIGPTRGSRLWDWAIRVGPWRWERWP